MYLGVFIANSNKNKKIKISKTNSTLVDNFLSAFGGKPICDLSMTPQSHKF